METIYHGQLTCQEDGCKNKAYFLVRTWYLCGVHSRNVIRKPLPKMEKNQKEYLYAKKRYEENKAIEAATAENHRESRKGKVILTQMFMRKGIEYVKGFRKVFPNYRHQNRKDGFGCSALSPMKLGPVEHGQPDLPIALNIENYHQSSKCFEEELDENKNPSPLYYSNREKWYNDPIPHRHKYLNKKRKNKNIPEFFIWVDKEKKEHRLTYVECRQFYCNFYERLASKEPDFLRLQEMINDGVNLQICGYDAHQPEDIEKAYLDESRAFGHEICLYTMLTMSPENYPWRKYVKFDF
jgi:hypothetical protein